MDKTIKIAVVGTGIIGASHLDAIAKSEECILCAVCDINEESAAKYAQKYGVPYFTDYRDLVTGTTADAVILNLPHFLHCEVTEFFLDHGMHVLVEKPMANTVEECDRMIVAAERSGKRLAVGHHQRFVPANRRVKEIYESGEMGKLCMVQETRTIDYFIPKRPKWFLDKRMAGGGIVMNYGAHALDKLFSITGYDKAEVTAVVDNMKNDAQVEGHAQILLKFEDGLSAAITFSGYTSTGYETTYYFTEGAARVSGGSALSLYADGKWEKQEIAGQSMEIQLAEFCKLVRGEESDIATPEYSRQIIATIRQIYQQ